MKWIKHLYILVLSLLIGITAGCIAYLFAISLNYILFLHQQYAFLLWFLPIGGLAVSFVYHRYGSNVIGGTSMLTMSIQAGDGMVPRRIVPLVWGGTLVTHLFGGSAGREGTALQLGGGVAATIISVVKPTLVAEQRRILLLSGMSAGFAALFGTPLAAAIFALEAIATGKQRLTAIIYCLAAGYIGYYTSIWLGLEHTAMTVTSIPTAHIYVYVKLILLTLLIAAAAYLFKLIVATIKYCFKKWIVLPYFHSFIGGLIILLLVYLTQSRSYLGLGLPIIADSFEEVAAPLTALFKLIFTAITVGSGFIGGEVTPLFAIGSALGSSLAPLLQLAPSYLAALGFVALFGAVSKAPIAAFVLGIELFGLELALPLLLVCVLSSLIARLLAKTLSISAFTT